MKEQYGEYEIRYEEYNERFAAYQDNKEVANSPSLATLRKKLDHIGKVRAKFKRFTILSLDDVDGILELEVTSVASGNDVWVVHDGKRSKVRLGNDRWGSNFYADTPKNRKLLAEAAALHKQRAAIYERIEAIVKKATAATVPSGAEPESSVEDATA